MKRPKGNGHHLTLSDRSFIAQELLLHSTFRSIAAKLDKDPSTISKEIRMHTYEQTSFQHKCSACVLFSSCSIQAKCAESNCNHYCLTCNTNLTAKDCDRFDPYSCPKLHKPPYVCNGCEDRKTCSKFKRVYDPVKAQKDYEKILTDSRSGINMSQEKLADLNQLISPLVKKGQPLSHIFAVHQEEIPVCRRTLYNYLDQRIFTARNMDLPRRIRYKTRKKKRVPSKEKTSPTFRNKRTYVDFQHYVEEHPDLDIVEMDTVKGGVSAGKCLLTLLFRSCSFMIVILLPDCTQQSVANAINSLCDTIGLKLFQKYFPILLTDNGSEFKNPQEIEFTPSGDRRTHVFFCDPYVSNQKARLEKNHEYIRYIIPKGRSMYRYNQDDINLMTSHINSTARDSLNGATPWDLAELLLDKRIPELIGLKKVSPDDVLLKPALIDHRTR